MHCPSCAEVLQKLPLLDSKRKGHVCVRGHRFFTWIEPFGRRFCVPGRVAPLRGSVADVDILRYWLTNPVAREQLVDLLAMVCERLIELIDDHEEQPDSEERRLRRLADAELKELAAAGREVDLLRFCPACGRPLSKYHDPENSWVDGLVCPAGHDFSYRGWRLWRTGDPTQAELWLFPRDGWLASTVDDAVISTEHADVWRELVHPQLRETLIRLHDRLR